MLVVFYTLQIVCICLFMTYSTYCCRCDRLINLWNVCVYV